MATKNPQPKKAGRPAGSANIETEVVVEASRCVKCGSTERAPYSNTHEQAFGGEIDGRPFTHIVRRNTACLNCGQARIDRTHENRPTG